MSDDPFMPSARRFPRDTWPPVDSDESPTDLRPFVLRGAQQLTGVQSAGMLALGVGSVFVKPGGLADAFR
jgi:hypothetical protein